MATTEQIKSIAELGAQILSGQLSFTDKTAEDALCERWPLGYCFGLFDALAGHYQLDQYTDGLAVLSIGFVMFAGSDEGASYLGRALDLQTDQTFSEGRTYGGNDVIEWLRTRGDFKPLFLMNYFTFGRPKPWTP